MPERKPLGEESSMGTPREIKSKYRRLFAFLLCLCLLNCAVQPLLPARAEEAAFAAAGESDADPAEPQPRENSSPAEASSKPPVIGKAADESLAAEKQESAQEPEKAQDPQSDLVPEAETEPQNDPLPEPEEEPQADPEPEPETEKTETEPQNKPQPEPEKDPQPKPQPVAEQEPQPDPAPETETDPQSWQQPEAEQEPVQNLHTILFEVSEGAHVTVSGHDATNATVQTSKPELVFSVAEADQYAIESVTVNYKHSAAHYQGREFEYILENLAGDVTIVTVATRLKPSGAAIRYRAAEGGSVSPAAETIDLSGANPHPSGALASALPGYDFVGWFDEGNNPVGNQAYFTPPVPASGEERVYTAVFKAWPAVSFSAQLDDGTVVRVQAPKASVPSGTVMRLREADPAKALLPVLRAEGKTEREALRDIEEIKTDHPLLTDVVCCLSIALYDPAKPDAPTAPLKSPAIHVSDLPYGLSMTEADALSVYSLTSFEDETAVIETLPETDADAP